MPPISRQQGHHVARVIMSLHHCHQRPSRAHACFATVRLASQQDMPLTCVRLHVALLSRWRAAPTKELAQLPVGGSLQVKRAVHDRDKATPGVTACLHAHYLHIKKRKKAR